MDIIAALTKELSVARNQVEAAVKLIDERSEEHTSELQSQR